MTAVNVKVTRQDIDKGFGGIEQGAWCPVERAIARAGYRTVVGFDEVTLPNDRRLPLPDVARQFIIDFHDNKENLGVLNPFEFELEVPE